MNDDREQYVQEQRRHAAAIGEDRALVDRAFALQTDAAAHRFTYLWNWLGVPIIQMPTDIVVMQEIIWETRPDLVIETGVARGGSLILTASILRLLGGPRRVIGIDVDIRTHNRATIESHPLADGVTLIEGSSTDPAIVERVRAAIEPAMKVMVVLDSDHSHDHVLAELHAYAPLVSPGAFLVVADTGLARPEARRLAIRDWTESNNPATALNRFLRDNSDFAPDTFYNGKLLMTSSPGGYLRCMRAT